MQAKSNLGVAKTFVVPIGIALLVGSLSAGEMRIWTDLQGRTIEARMVGLEGNSVLLELKNGRKASVPLDKLTAKDSEYARNSKDDAGTPAAPQETRADANFDGPVPSRVKYADDPAITVIEEQPDTASFIYESTHYRYVSNVRLPKSSVKELAVILEATNKFCRELPLGLDGCDAESGSKLKVKLFGNAESYRAAGGPADSGGVFDPNSGQVLVNLGGKRGKNWDGTLVHELTHQLSPKSYLGLNWFCEGIAQYLEATPYRSGSFDVRGNLDSIIAYATGSGLDNQGGRQIGKDIRLPSLREFMLQNDEKFCGPDESLNYGAALLITYYFLHLEGKGDGKLLKQYLKDLRQGETCEEAVQKIFATRSAKDLESELGKAWKKKGINITFGAT